MLLVETRNLATELFQAHWPWGTSLGPGHCCVCHGRPVLVIHHHFDEAIAPRGSLTSCETLWHVSPSDGSEKNAAAQRWAASPGPRAHAFEPRRRPVWSLEGIRWSWGVRTSSSGVCRSTEYQIYHEYALIRGVEGGEMSGGPNHRTCLEKATKHKPMRLGMSKAFFHRKKTDPNTFSDVGARRVQSYRT